MAHNELPENHNGVYGVVAAMILSTAVAATVAAVPASASAQPASAPELTMCQFCKSS